GVKVSGKKINIPKGKEYDRNFLDAIESASNGKIKVIPKDEFIFYIESFGSYSAEKILEIGLNQLDRKIQNIISLLLNS
ncbi:MAG: DNA-directed RNA polymerase subunit D, partial [Nanopusillaceae archaeon]